MWSITSARFQSNGLRCSIVWWVSATKTTSCGKTPNQCGVLNGTDHVGNALLALLNLISESSTKLGDALISGLVDTTKENTRPVVEILDAYFYGNKSKYLLIVQFVKKYEYVGHGENGWKFHLKVSISKMVHLSKPPPRWSRWFPGSSNSKATDPDLRFLLFKGSKILHDMKFIGSHGWFCWDPELKHLSKSRICFLSSFCWTGDKSPTAAL